MMGTSDDTVASDGGAEPPTNEHAGHEPDPAGVSGAATNTDAPKVDPRLLEILVCPLTKTTLEYDAENQELVSRAARLAYPIRDGIPVMLAEEARALPERD